MAEDSIEIVRRIGAGATSEVYEARDRVTQRIVALKLFSPLVSADPSLLERLRSEVEVLSQLKHPHVVTLFGERVWKDRFALELELVSGTNLREWMEKNPVTSDFMEIRLWLLVQIARGLGGAHERQFLHRDLKPENILISREGYVKLTDFGLARSIDRYTFTRSGFLVGSLGYMAPEAIDGKKTDERSDIFSFGVLAYELLAGHPPFAFESPQGIIRAVFNEEYRKLSELAPHIDPRLAQALEGCLKKDPHARPANIWVVEALLMTLLSESGLLKLIPRLLADDASPELYREALVYKKKILEERLAERAQMDLLADYRRLFPEADWFRFVPRSRLPVQVLNRIGKAVAIGVLVLLFAAGIRRWQVVQNRDVPTRVATVPPLPMDPLPAVPSEVKARKTRTPTVAKTVSPPMKAMGRLQFHVPPDVEVFIDNQSVANVPEGASVTEGLHALRLVRAGYLPVESDVEVRAGRTTVINGRGGQ